MTTSAEAPLPSGSFPVLVVSGLSGAGKSTVLQVFEDLRYFTIDGLPASLAPAMVRILKRQELSHYHGIVLGMDLRQTDFVPEFEKALDAMLEQGVHPKIVFIEADRAVLMRRYATTRRPHPLESEGMGLEMALAEERERLEPIRALADSIIDTSTYSIHDLRRTIQREWTEVPGNQRSLRVHVVSFGFKYGVPKEADLVFDLRFLANPYFDPALKALSGKEKAVADYVFASEAAQEFRRRFLDFMLFMLPQFEAEGRYRLTVAIGCTGGRHRSVAMAEHLFAALQGAEYAVTLEHRHCELG